jgi:pimeloyl-ACP methyl ester carboxylesterase
VRPVRRRDVTFSSSGVRCAAWFYEPDDPAPGPCLVMAHGFGALRTGRLDAFAERFAAAGMRALVFDYRHFGDSEGEPRQLLDIGRQLDDWRAAIDFARGLAGVDPARVAAWGTSFSGGHVAVMAAEGRVAAAVSQSPFLDGVATLAVAGLANSVRLTLAALRDEQARLRGLPPHLIPIVGPPGSTAAMNQPDAEPGYRAMYPSPDGFRNEVAARFALRLSFYRPARLAREIACPWLVCVCDGDSVVPPAVGRRAARRAPAGELRRYDAGHFEIYSGPLFEQAVRDQLEFLHRALGQQQVNKSSLIDARILHS